MNKGFTIPATIYPVPIHIFYGEEDNAHKYFKKTLEKKDKKHIKEFFVGEYNARTCQTNYSGIALHFKCISHTTIAHEMFHCVEYIMKHIGVSHCDETSEQFAYYLGYLVEQVNKELYERT